MWWPTPVSPAFGRQGQWIFLSSSLVRTIQWEPCLKVVVVVGGSRGIKKKQNKTVFMPSCCFNCFYFNFLKWNPVFPFGIAFMMRPQFYTTKYYNKQLTSPQRWALLQFLGLIKKKVFPEGTMRWAASPSVLSLGLLSPVAKSCDGIFVISTPHCSPDICDQSHSSPPYVMVSNLVAFSR